MLVQPRKQSRLVFTILILAIIFFSCKKDNTSSSNTQQPDLTTKVTASSVSGFVIDENNNPVEAASVKVGSMSTTTNQYGFFEIKQVEVIKTAATITVNKAGYFRNIRTFGAIDGKSASTTIKLVPKIINGTINATAGGSVSLPNGLVVALPANGVVNASTSAAYSGNINVSMYLLDPTATDFIQTNIGDQLGITKLDGSLKLLNGFSGIGVELTGASGELLQIAPDKKASLTLPIPSSLVPDAASQIPLWNFDENSGLWKEDGLAIKNGNTYTADVSHFSWWNAATSTLYIEVTGNIVDANNIPVMCSGAFPIFTFPNGMPYGGYINNQGHLWTLIPDATTVTLNVYANSSCNTSVYTQSITGAGADIDLGNIVLNSNATTTVTGSLIDCGGNPLSNGCVYLSGGAMFTRFEADNTGNFSIPIMICNNNTVTVDAIGQNLTTTEFGNPVSFTLNAGNNALGNIIACGNTAQEYFYFNVDGVNHSLFAPAYFTDGVDVNVSWRYLYADDNATSVSLTYDNTNIGLNTDQTLFSFRGSPYTDSSRCTNPIMVHITEFGNIGEYVSGNFTGSVTGVPAPNTVHNVSCNFRIKRHQ